MSVKSRKITARPVSTAKVSKKRATKVFASREAAMKSARTAVSGRYVVHGKPPNPNRARQSFLDALKDSVRTNREAIRRLADK